MEMQQMMEILLGRIDAMNKKCSCGGFKQMRRYKI
jgi:hypothetical protein